MSNPLENPQDAIQQVQRHILEMEVQLHEMDARFHEQFATASFERALELLELFWLNRFDACAGWLQWTATSSDATINPEYEKRLDEIRQKTLIYCSEALAPLSPDVREDFLSKLHLQLRSRQIKALADAKRRHLAAITRDAYEAPGAPIVAERTPPVAPATDRPISSKAAYVFRRESDGTWTLDFVDRRSEKVRDVVGFTLIQTLLMCPRRPVPAVVLMGREDSSEGMSTFDEQTAREVAARLGQLRNERDLAIESGNSQRRAELEEEARELAEYRSRGTSVSGKPRRLGSDAERARKAARKRYQVALRRLSKVNPALTHHLREIHTGSTFVYEPREDLDWQM